MSRFCRPSKAARYLGRHVSTVIRWIQSGRLPAERVGRDYRVLKSDVRALRRRVVPAGPAAPSESAAHREAVRRLREAGLM